MPDKTIKHEVKLQKSVIVILAVMGFGLCANAFAPVFSVKDAIAQMGPIGTFKIKLDNAGSAGNPFIIKCFGCD